MKDLLKTELYKLIHNRSFWIILLFTFALGSLLLLDSRYLTSGLLKASLYNTPLLYFLVIIFAVLFIGEDFENRTLHGYISTGHKRSLILLAKSLIYLLASGLILTIPLMFYGIVGTVCSGNNHLSLASVLLDLVLVLIAVLAMGMLPLSAAFIFKDVGKTLAVPMILYFLMIFGLNSGYAQQIATVLPMGQIRLLSLNELLLPKIKIIGIDILWIGFLYIGAYMGFCRSDLG